MTDSQTRIAVLGGARTPFAKAGTALAEHKALDLAVHSVDGLVAKQGIEPGIVDELVYGIVTLDPRVPQLAREINFGSVLPDDVRSYTITDNCITGITALSNVADSIRSGRASVGIAGGVESLSNPAIMVSRNASRILYDLSRARTTRERVKLLRRLRPRDLKPRAPGVTEPSTGLSMGEHTEITVKEWAISRIEQDEIAFNSHMNGAAATADGRLVAEIHPLDGLDHDPIVRPGTTMEKLAGLQPVFDRSAEGTLTAGNSSPLTDGAAAVLVASESAAARHGLEPLAFVKDVEFVAISPDDGLLMGPGIAVPRLLSRHGLTLDDLDLIDMHEAFAGQIAANIAAWERGWKEPPIGKVDRERLNVAGGSIAIGHPFAATGARIVTQAANEMARRDAKLALVSVCGAGATAAAVLLERD
ncbi:MAG: acetyl-CoA C-acyltransferase [Acidimicrobiia bacterium]